jgi:hypothetical protein
VTGQKEYNVIRIHGDAVGQLPWRELLQDRPSVRLAEHVVQHVHDKKEHWRQGIPCCKPLAWQMRSPCAPFSRIHVLADESSTEIHSRQTIENPTCYITSMSNGHDTLLKALEMSTLRHRLACRVLAVD